MTWTALDVGTTKICTIIAQTNKSGEIEICGLGKAASDGLARGMIIDTQKAIESIKASVAEAERMARRSSGAVYVGISGNHIGSLNSHGVIAIKGKEIRPHDIAAVISAAKAVPLPEGHQILHAVPQYFIINGSHLVPNPLGMHGVRLEAAVHLITGEVTAVQNLVSCCDRANLKVKDIILEPIASAEATLTGDERELGVAMLDIGGGTSDFAVYHRGTIRHTKIFPIAGNIFTNDLAVCLRTTRDEAERIKKEFGHASEAYASRALPLAIQSLDHVHTHTISTSDITCVLEARTTELLDLIANEMDEYRLKPYMAAGMIITGGGALLQGIAETAHDILGIPVRIGIPRVEDTEIRSELESPLYATSYGLALYPHLQHKLSLTTIQGPMIKKVFCRMTSWVYDLF